MKKGKKVTAELIFLILMTVLMTALTGCNKTDKITDTTENPVIKIGSDNYPPYNFLNEDGMPTGIDVDLATEAFGRMGYKIEIIPISWEQKKKMLENGEIDCIMGCFSMKGRLDEESIIQYMKDYNMELRILDEPLMTVGLGVAFAKDDTRGICQKLEQTLADMKEDGTAAKIIGKYLDDPEKYLEVDKIGEE